MLKFSSEKKILQKTFLIILLLCNVFFVPFTHALDKKESFKPVVEKLIKDGFDKKWVNKIYADAHTQFDQKNVSLFLMHQEGRLNYDQFTTGRSIKKAKKYQIKHQKALDSTEKKYGVEQEVVIAIILVETRLGTVLGNTSILNILSTMAALSNKKTRDLLWAKIAKKSKYTRKKYDDWCVRKSKWAYNELKAYLKFVRRERQDPVKVHGSYAGALGIAQFMPSSILMYGRDGDNDGRINLFTHPDAIASAAYYLKRYGWKSLNDKKKAFKAVFNYNRSDYYVKTVLKVADLLRK